MIGVAKDLEIEPFRKEDEIPIIGTHRIKAQVIDAPATRIMIFPKEQLACGFGCAIYNAIEQQRGSDTVWRVR